MDLRYLFVLFILLVSACIRPEVRSLREVGGPYNAKIVQEKMKTIEGNEVWVDKVQYTYNFGEVRAYLAPGLEAGLSWLKNNTQEGDKIMCWWDYGSSVRGYTGREVVIDAPSKSILDTVAGGWIGPTCSEGDVRDVAEALVTTNPNKTIELMKKHGANYILVHGSELTKVLVLFRAAGIPPNEYIIYNTEGDFRLSPKGMNTMFARMMNNDGIDGFEEVSASDYYVLWQLKE